MQVVIFAEYMAWWEIRNRGTSGIDCTLDGEHCRLVLTPSGKQYVLYVMGLHRREVADLLVILREDVKAKEKYPSRLHKVRRYRLFYCHMFDLH